MLQREKASLSLAVSQGRVCAAAPRQSQKHARPARVWDPPPYNGTTLCPPPALWDGRTDGRGEGPHLTNATDRAASDCEGGTWPGRGLSLSLRQACAAGKSLPLPGSIHALIHPVLLGRPGRAGLPRQGPGALWRSHLRPPSAQSHSLTPPPPL